MAVNNPFSEKLKYRFTNQVKGVKPINDHVLVTEMSFGMRTLSSGIVMLGDDGKTDGIRPRWAQVHSVGPDQTTVKVGDWILVEHGRWTRGMDLEIDGERITLRRVDPDAIMLVSDEPPEHDDIISTAVHAEHKTRNQYE